MLVTECILLETILTLGGACSKSPRENNDNADTSLPRATATEWTEAACHGLGHRGGHLSRSSYSRFQDYKSSGSPTISWMLTYALDHFASVLFQEVPVLPIKGLRNEK